MREGKWNERGGRREGGREGGRDGERERELKLTSDTLSTQRAMRAVQPVWWLQRGREKREKEVVRERKERRRDKEEGEKREGEKDLNMTP